VADQGWKRHEREVAGFFGTQRALHGIDRSDGQVDTDVFVDGAVWKPSVSWAKELALVVECKYTKAGSSSNAWMLPLIQGIKKEAGVKEAKAPVVIHTKDSWTWMQIEDFELYLVRDVFGRTKKHIVGYPVASTFGSEVRHINKNMSEFFRSAMGQADLAVLPSRDPSYKTRMNVVCVGSNARLPRCIGLGPQSIISI